MKNVTIDGDTAVISVMGRYDLVRTLEVEEELKKAYGQGCTKVIVDFAHTKYSDSSVNRQLKKIRVQVGAENFQIKNATGAVLKAFKTAKLDKFFGLDEA